MKVPVGISNRHVHLTKEIKDTIFGSDYELVVKRPLNQTGEFASEAKVTLKTEKGVIEGVRVVGPLRNYTQVEILESDEEVLGLKSEPRNSGELDNTPGITIVGEKGEVYVPSCVIIANRHIHMTPNDALNFGVVNDQVVSVKKDNVVIDNVHVKIKDNYVLECHLDRDDEMIYNIHTGEEVEVLK